MNVTLKRDDDLDHRNLPMTWRPARMYGEEKASGAWLVDEHGHLGRISFKPGGWTVDATGKVTPSILQKSCGWHVYATLEGFDAAEFE